MKTEEYIIIILTVMEENGKVNIVYTSTSEQLNVTVKVLYSNGHTIQIFERVRKAEKGLLSFSSENLLPGTYTCTIDIDGKVRDTKNLIIGR